MSRGDPFSDGILTALVRAVVGRGICTGCGACVSTLPREDAKMVDSPNGLIPSFANTNASVPDLFWEACPGKGIDYPRLYQLHYGTLPDDWKMGIFEGSWTGYAADPLVRSFGASGGVVSAVLIYLLETGSIDAAVVVRRGDPGPEDAAYTFARSRDDILACSQSVYVPVSMLDSLRDFVPGERYAMTCLPEQSAALRVLQHAGDPRARQVTNILGPFTGTALDKTAVRAVLRGHRVPDDDAVADLSWRAGEWPGYLEIHTRSGRMVRETKPYYNYLIPFYITQTSLQSMDFANEFADLAVGDAWSPSYENRGEGFSVVFARTPAMLDLLHSMLEDKKLVLDPLPPTDTDSMHGHMIDFKKRGGYLRNQMRLALGLAAPDYGLRPRPIGISRVLVELAINAVLVLCRTGPARWTLQKISPAAMGPVFSWLRRVWKSASRSAKRAGLPQMTMETRAPLWRHP